MYTSIPNREGGGLKGRESFVSFCLTHLLETDVLGVLSEASSAKLESVLTDDTVVASADAAVKKKEEERRRRRKDNPSVRKEQKKENSKNSFPTGGQAKRGTKIEYETASSSLLCRFFLFSKGPTRFSFHGVPSWWWSQARCVCVFFWVTYQG